MKSNRNYKTFIRRWMYVRNRTATQPQQQVCIKPFELDAASYSSPWKDVHLNNKQQRRFEHTSYSKVQLTMNLLCKPQHIEGVLLQNIRQKFCNKIALLNFFMKLLAYNNTYDHEISYLLTSMNSTCTISHSIKLVKYHYSHGCTHTTFRYQAVSTHEHLDLESHMLQNICAK